MHGNVGMVSNLPQPSRPPEPSAPEGFPPIALLWTRTVDPRAGEVSFAMLEARPSLHTTSAPAPSDGEPARGSDAGAAPAPAPPAAAAGEESLGIVVAPQLAAGATGEQRSFHDTATRAVRRIVEQDFDDPSIALALREQLARRPELAPLRASWEPLFDDAIERAKLLQMAAPALRTLRQAYAGAKKDPKGFYRDIDQPACRQAFAMLFEVALEAIEVPVSLPNIPRLPLREVDELCRDSHMAILAERSFPPLKGTAGVRRFVRRLYTNTYPEAAAHKISIPGGWEVSEDGERRTLRAIIGVKRENAFPQDPCMVEEIAIHQTKSGAKFEETECCDVVSSWAIACEQLE